MDRLIPRVGRTNPLFWDSVRYKALCQQRLPQPNGSNRPILPRQVPQTTAGLSWPRSAESAGQRGRGSATRKRSPEGRAVLFEKSLVVLRQRPAVKYPRIAEHQGSYPTRWMPSFRSAEVTTRSPRLLRQPLKGYEIRQSLGNGALQVAAQQCPIDAVLVGLDNGGLLIARSVTQVTARTTSHPLH